MKSHMVVLHSAIVSAIVELYISFDIVHSWNLQLFCVIKLNLELFDLYYWVWTIVELSVVWHNEPQFSSLLKKTIDQTNCIFSFDTYIFSSAKGVWTFQFNVGMWIWCPLQDAPNFRSSEKLLHLSFQSFRWIVSHVATIRTRNIQINNIRL